MAIQTRNSALAVKVESTEGTPVEPAASGDYLALQDDFAMSPAFDTLDNAELKASIGKAKSILGLEQPSASFSHYVRHSGVEGDAPNYGTMLKGIFGSEDVESTEYNTVAGSTSTVVNVDTGEGATFIRGQALLIKDATNGYRIRNVESISGDALTLGFGVPTAPGTGVNLGKAVTYAPVSTGHPTYSVWHYLGNSGAIQMMSGARVVGADISIEAGGLINASYSMEGVEYYFNPITLSATSNKLDFDEGGSELNATLTAKTYKDPHDLASAIQTAMNDLAVAGITVTYSNTTGKFTIVSDGATLNLLWSTGANTANTIAGKIGFSAAADDTGALTYTSDNAQVLSSPQSPSFDTASPLVAKNNEVMLGTATDYACFEASSVSVAIGAPKTDILSVCATSGKSGSVVQERTVEIQVSSLLSQYDADKFRAFRENDNVKFQYSFGNKSGGNWVAGQCGSIFCPTATVTAFELADQDGLVAMNLTLTGYVNDSGEGEVYMSFV